MGGLFVLILLCAIVLIGARIALHAGGISIERQPVNDFDDYFPQYKHDLK
ncbi:hypothetical protein [Bacillus sp. FJAT-47783]|nr:hypothetical protein [Bacillus sp. FJAT-47783]